jgi:hypothetical protein
VLNRGRPIVYNDIGYRIIFEQAAASAFEKETELGLALSAIDMRNVAGQDEIWHVDRYIDTILA